MLPRKHARADRFRQAAGLILAIAAAALLVASAWPAPAPQPDVYASAGHAPPAVRPLPLVTSGPVAVNDASFEDLLLLPGIGETLSQAILDERDAHGPFYYPENLLAVRGIGQKKLDGLRDWLDLTPATPGD